MPSNTNMKQMQQVSTKTQGQLTAALPRPRRKAPGTRAGTLRDWRGEGSNKPGKTSGGIGKAVRDGR